MQQIILYWYSRSNGCYLDLMWVLGVGDGKVFLPFRRSSLHCGATESYLTLADKWGAATKQLRTAMGMVFRHFPGTWRVNPQASWRDAYANSFSLTAKGKQRASLYLPTPLEAYAFSGQAKVNSAVLATRVTDKGNYLPYLWQVPITREGNFLVPSWEKKELVAFSTYANSKPIDPITEVSYFVKGEKCLVDPVDPVAKVGLCQLAEADNGDLQLYLVVWDRLWEASEIEALIRFYWENQVPEVAVREWVKSLIGKPTTVTSSLSIRLNDHFRFEVKVKGNLISGASLRGFGKVLIGYGTT